MIERSESMETVFSNCMGGMTKEDAVETGTEGAVAEFDATERVVALDLFLGRNGQYQNSITDSTSNGDRGGTMTKDMHRWMCRVCRSVCVFVVVYHVMYGMVTRRIGQHGWERRGLR